MSNFAAAADDQTGEGAAEGRAPRWVWRVRVSWGGRSVADRAFADGARVTVGEGSASSFVLPGLDRTRRDGVPLIDRAGARVPEGFAGTITRPETTEAVPVTAGEGLVLRAGDRANLRVLKHPEIEVELRRERAGAVGPMAFGTFREAWRAFGRDLLYGAAALALLGLGTAVTRPVADVSMMGHPGVADSPIARAMFNATADAPVTTRTRWAAVAAPEPEPEPEPPVVVGAVTGVVGADNAEGPDAEAPTPKRPTSERVTPARAKPRPRAAPPSPEAGPVDRPGPGTGRSSHERQGAETRAGDPEGTAAVAPAVTCSNPEERPKENVDVVFVIDVSTTMGFMLDSVERGIGDVDRTLRSLDRDARYGLVVFVDDVQVSNGGRPFASLTALRRELRRLRQFTSTNRQIHSEERNLDWPENSLDALHAAAERYAWRDDSDTLRLVIHATDDDFREAPSVQSGQRVQHSYRQTVRALQRNHVRVASFAARVGGQCECLDVEPGWFTRYRGQPSIPDATGGAVFDIDELVAGQLEFADAVRSTVKDRLCRQYPVFDALRGIGRVGD